MVYVNLVIAMGLPQQLINRSPDEGGKNPPSSSHGLPDLKIFSRPLAAEGTSVLVGFPGSGLVGSIALQYMVDQLDFELIGTMTSKYFPPLAMMNKGVINDPVRIYAKNDLAAIVADIPIHPMICYEVSNGIMDWLAPFKPKEVVTIAGIITNESEKRVLVSPPPQRRSRGLQTSPLSCPSGASPGSHRAFSPSARSVISPRMACWERR